MVADPGCHLGVGGLDQEGPDPTHERGTVAHHTPGDGVRPEEAGVVGMGERVRQRVGGMAEEADGCFGDAALPCRLA